MMTIALNPDFSYIEFFNLLFKNKAHVECAIADYEEELGEKDSAKNVDIEWNKI